ncbi:MAG TPA: hypothetical protein VIL63_04350 [Terriglobales bacterium]
MLAENRSLSALDVTYKKAPKARKAAEEQMPLAGAEAEDEGPF